MVSICPRHYRCRSHCYPEASLAPRDLDRLREDIYEEIDALPGEGHAPRLDDILIKLGATVVQAADIW